MEKLTREWDFSKLLSAPPKEITKAHYLVGTTRGAYQGHAGLILEDNQGGGILYSTGFSLKRIREVAEGKWLPYYIYRKELSKEQMSSYFETGKIPDTGENPVQWAYLSNYDKYITIPVKDPVLGNFMMKRADYLVQNPGSFNLYERNCNHICQEILSAGGLNFTPTRGDVDLIKVKVENLTEYLKKWDLLGAIYYANNEYKKLMDLGIIPNGAYEKGLEWAKQNGYPFGEIQKSRKPFKENETLDKESKIFDFSVNSRSKTGLPSLTM